VTTSASYDLIIVGAGMAGSAAAIELGARGHRVLLVDKARFPRDKACGEGLMPAAVDHLARLGVLDALHAAGARPVRGIRYHNRRQARAEADFPSGGAGAPWAGLALRRLVLDDVLIARARAEPTVEVREGFRVTAAEVEGDTVVGVRGRDDDVAGVERRFTAPLTLGADGHLSIFHGQLGIQRQSFRRRRYGVSGHFAGVAGLEDYVEVYLGDEAEAYLAPVGPDTALVALLVEARAMPSFAGRLDSRYEELARCFPALGARLRASRLLPPVSAVGPLGFRVRPLTHNGLMLIGDSAGFIDPVTGEGMSLALKSVAAAVPVIDRAFRQRDFSRRVLAEYETRRRHALRDVRLLTHLVLAMAGRPALADRAIAVLARHRGLFTRLLAVAGGRRSLIQALFAPLA